MDWKTIRLELAPTAGFPSGSASRVYLLRLPLDARGIVDAQAVDRDPMQATVRRFWGSEPDRHGRIERNGDAWVFRYGSLGAGESVSRFEPQALIPDGNVVVEEPDGSRLPFRVASVRGLGPMASPAH